MVTGKALRRFVLLQGAALLTLGAQAAQAGNVGVNLNINLGEPPRQVIVAPPPPVYVAPPPQVYVPPPPAYAPPAYPPPVEYLQVEDDIHFVYPSDLGFYVAVGVPYDLFYLQNSYFLYRDGRWLRAPSSRGPWVVQRYRELPPGLRRYKLERIRDYRAREYAVYSRDREHYRGRHFRSDKEQWRAQHREVKELRKEERRLEKEGRKDERRAEKEQRKEEKRYEKEERREHREHGEGRGN
jgi:hypothetical protein